MTKYAAFDAALLSHIRLSTKPIKMATLQKFTDLKDLAEPHRTSDRWGDKTPVYRIIDRRLQSLRHAGMIRSTTMGWVVE